MPLARLWSAFPLFEAVDAIAIAHSTRRNLEAVDRFAAGARRYFNPALRPVPGFAYYPGIENAPGRRALAHWPGYLQWTPAADAENGLLMVHAATTSLFAWLAAAPVPPRL